MKHIDIFKNIFIKIDKPQLKKLISDTELYKSFILGIHNMLQHLTDESELIETINLYLSYLKLFDLKSDIFNLASFNSTVDSIARIVSEYTKAEITDNGNPLGAYNFAIDNTKFKVLGNFTYEDNLHSVIENVIECYKNKNPEIVIRNEYFQYD